MAQAGDNKLLMGRIGAAHGIKGEVRIQSFTEDPLALVSYGPLSTDKPGLTIKILSARMSARFAFVPDMSWPRCSVLSFG